MGSITNGMSVFSGVIPYAEAMDKLEYGKRRLIKKMEWGWTNPTMSIILAQNGHVRAVLENRKKDKWEPFRINNLNNILNRKYFTVQLQ